MPARQVHSSRLLCPLPLGEGEGEELWCPVHPFETALTPPFSREERASKPSFEAYAPLGAFRNLPAERVVHESPEKEPVMTLLQEAEKLRVAMSRGEKAQLRQWVVQDVGDAFPG